MAEHTEAGANLRKLAKNRKYDELETEVLEVIEAESATRAEIGEALGVVARRGDPETADNLDWIAVTSIAEKYGAEEALDFAKALAEGLPKGELLREETASLYRQVYADYPGFEDVVTKVVENPEIPLPEAAVRANIVLHMPPGTYVVKKGRKEPGRVRGLSEAGDGIAVEYAEGDTTFAFAETERLDRLDPEDFRPLKVFEPERITAIAGEDPGGLVERILRSGSGSLTYRELRAELVDLAPGGWSTWWSEARPIVQRHPWVEMSAGKQPSFELRRTPVAHDARMRDEFDEADEDEALTIVLDYLDQAGDHAKEEAELVAHIAAVLAERAVEGDAAERLANLAVLARLRIAAPDALPEEPPGLPEADRNPADLLFPLDDPRLKRAVLELVRSTRGGGEGAADWPAFFVAAMPACDPETCEWAARTLAEAGFEADLPGVASAILAHPHEFSESMIWVWKTAPDLIGREGGPDPERLLLDFLSVTERSLRGAENKLGSRLKTTLAAKGYATARLLMEAIDEPAARRVKDALTRYPGLTDQMRMHVSDRLVDTHPLIYADDVPPWKQEDVIWSTRGGLSRKKDEYGVLVNEKLPAIAEAVGRAAAHGDLSENAEYTAALEERERMTERANAMKAELDMASVIPDDAADGEEVTVGSRIRVRETATGEEREFSFLGPWDVRVEEGIFSYRAPLSLAFMGHAAGDEVEVTTDGDTKTYEILEVTSAVH